MILVGSVVLGFWAGSSASLPTALLPGKEWAFQVLGEREETVVGQLESTCQRPLKRHGASGIWVCRGPMGIASSEATLLSKKSLLYWFRWEVCACIRQLVSGRKDHVALWSFKTVS